MAPTIGVAGVKIKEREMTNTSRSAVKMRIRSRGASMVALASMQNAKSKGFIAEGNELHGSCEKDSCLRGAKEAKSTNNQQPASFFHRLQSLET